MVDVAELVVSGMVRLIDEHDQILGGVVVLVPILVVDDLARIEGATQHLSRYGSVRVLALDLKVRTRRGGPSSSGPASAAP